MTLTLIDHAYHRNGISGVPFDVVRFHDPQAGPMLGVVFREPGCVAVLNLDKLSAGDIAFGSNSWRGDRYEPALRRLVATVPGREDGEPGTEGPLPAEADELDELLIRRRQIAQVWCVEDVLSVRPDLTADQAWAVLQRVDQTQDASLGITWDSLEWAAAELFGHGPDADDDDDDC